MAGGSRDQSSSSSSKRKRSNPAAATPGLFSGVLNSAESKDIDLLCPICFEMLQETHMTKCGHSFCYDCICRCLEQGPRCPKCNFHLDGKNDIFPNFVLNELVSKICRFTSLVKTNVLDKNLFLGLYQFNFLKYFWLACDLVIIVLCLTFWIVSYV